MVRCASLFSQLVALFSRREFYRLVVKHRAELYSKGFSSRDHFAAMLFCQLVQAKILREIRGGLACTTGKLRIRINQLLALSTRGGIHARTDYHTP